MNFRVLNSVPVIKADEAPQLLAAIQGKDDLAEQLRAAHQNSYYRTPSGSIRRLFPKISKKSRRG